MSRLSAQAIVRLSAVPDSSLRRALNGTVDAVRRSQKQIETSNTATQVKAAREALATERYKQQVAERGARLQIAMANAERREKERAEKGATRDKEREAKARQRLAERQAKAEAKAVADAEQYKRRVAEAGARLNIAMHNAARRETEKTARTQIREAEKAAREVERTNRQAAERTRQFWRNAATVGGAVAGAAGGAYAFSSKMGGDLGIQSPSQTIGSAKEITESLIRSLGQAGFGGDFVKKTVQEIDAAGKRNKVDQGALAAGMLKAQAKYSDPKFFQENMDFIAQLSRASGSSPEVITDFMMGQRQIGGLTDQQTVDLAKTSFIQGGKGAIEFKDVAGTFAPTIATFAQDVGARGPEDMQQIQAIVQILGKSLKNPAEVATTMERFSSRLKQKGTQNKLRAIGVDIADEKGNIDRSPGEILEMLSKSPKLANPQARQAVFKDLLGESAAATMITQLQVDPNLFRDLMNVDPQQGADLINKINEQLDSTVFSKIDAMNIAAQSVTLTNEGNFIGSMIDIAKGAQGVDTFATEHPWLSGILSTVGAAGLGSAITRRLAGTPAKVLPRLLPGATGGAVATSAEGAGGSLWARLTGAPLGGLTGGSLVAGGGAVGLGALALAPDSVVQGTINATGIGGALDSYGGALKGVFGDAFSPKDGMPVQVSKDSVAALAEAINKHPGAVVRIQVDGPGRVTRVEETDMRIDLGTGSGRMSAAR